VIVFRMCISSGCICLPNLDQAIRHRVTIPVHYSPAHDDAFSQRFSRMLKRKVLIVGMNAGMAKDRARDFGKSLWKQDQRLGWRPQPCRAIRGIQIVRLRTWFMAPEGSQGVPGILTLGLHR
jgi:hypothetical protein